MGVKAVDHVEQGRVFGGLLGQVGRAAAAKHQHVDLVLHAFCRIHMQHLCARVRDPEGLRVAAGEHRFQLHIRILANRGLHTAAQIAIPQNTDTNGHSSEVSFTVCRKSVFFLLL